MQEEKGEEIIQLISDGQYENIEDKLSSLHNGEIDGQGNTLYHEAVKRQDTKLLRWLLSNYQKTIPPFQPNKDGSTCFHIACAGGKTLCFQALWEESKIQPKVWCESEDRDGHTPLHAACLGGQQDVAREIISKLKDAIVYQTNKKGQTTLHLAAAAGHLSCVRLLSNYKKLINGVDFFGATPLHYATIGGHLATVEYLIQRCKADKLRQTVNCMNLVHAAVASGELGVVKYILSKTKNGMHTATTATGATVLHIATGMGFEDVLQFLLTNRHIYRVINYPEMNGWTPAHLAGLRNRAACLAILIGFAADVHKVRDKNHVSAYQIMCNNESDDMRKTFPHLFEQLDSLRGHRKAEMRYKSSKHGKSRETSTMSTSHATTSNQNGHKPSRKESRKRTPSLSASDIMESKMDFTKTNPLVYDAPVSLQQRRFHKNNMALPNNGYTDKIPIVSYHDDDSDGDFHIDDIEHMPETPMRKIQESNNFRHSTYTPTQSTEDLTKIDATEVSPLNSKTSKVSAQEVSDYIHLINERYITNGSLPIILDYADQMKEGEEPITIYFHNGILNTVKVKTLVNPSGDGHFQQEKASTDGKPATTIEVYEPPEDERITQMLEERMSNLSETSSLTNSLPPTPPPPLIEMLVLDTNNHKASAEPEHLEPPISPSDSVLPPMPPPLEELGWEMNNHKVSADEPEHLESAISSNDYLLPPPPPPPLKHSPPRLIIPSQTTEMVKTDLEGSPPLSPINFNEYEFPDGIASSQIEQPSLPHSPNREMVNFEFQTIETAHSSNVEDHNSLVGEETKSAEDGAYEVEKATYFSAGETPTTPDTVERAYLRFAENELNTENVTSVEGRHDSKDSNINVTISNPATAEEPEYAVIRKKKPPNTDANRVLRRLSSNASDINDTNFELKSSTSYKFNYRAYRKKISTKHDTVTDLFVYNPIN